jgi:membrane associated rhomboid family serine protease
MLDDRPYMQSPYQPKTTYSAVVMLIVICAGVFLLQIFTQPSGSSLLNSVWGQYFYLSQTGITRGFLWQLITFQFIHGNLLHLLFNCWGLYLFGRSVEESQGKAGFFRLYFLSGIAGGLLHVIIAWGIFGNTVPALMVGASAGVYGLIAVFARLWPDTPLTMFPIPITIKVKHLFFILLAIAGLGLIFSKGSGISHAGHFGGAIAGLLYVYFVIEGNSLSIGLPSRPSIRKTTRQAQPVSKVGNVLKRVSKSGKGNSPLTEEEFISREVDPILEKISAHGIHSLTETERKILESARSRLSGRLKNR